MRVILIALIILTAWSIEAWGAESKNVGQGGNADRIDVTANKGGGTATTAPVRVKRGTGAPIEPLAPIDCNILNQERTQRFMDECTVATPTLRPLNPQQTRRQQQATFATNYFRSLELPAPRPKISAPNGGITGATHSLDLQVPQQVVFTDPQTEFGALVVSVSATFTVEWGDGTKTTHHNSNATHTWTKVGTYDITVTARWSATWSFGDTSGTLGGLTTTGAISDWPVLQAQAVIVR